MIPLSLLVETAIQFVDLVRLNPDDRTCLRVTTWIHRRQVLHYFRVGWRDPERVRCFRCHRTLHLIGKKEAA
jgi:hypothetical protein